MHVVGWYAVHLIVFITVYSGVVCIPLIICIPAVEWYAVRLVIFLPVLGWYAVRLILYL